MSLLDVFRKEKAGDNPVKESEVDLTQLTSKSEVMEIKTLDQSLGFIADQNAKIQGLQNELAEKNTTIQCLNEDLQACIQIFGLSRQQTDGVVKWESSVIKDLTQARDEAFSKLATAEAKISELKANEVTVQVRAREMLAAQGGKPLPVSGTGQPKPTNKAEVMEAMDQARRAGDQAAVKRYYKELQELKKS